MDSKFLFVVITSILIGINSCIPGEEMGMVTARRGLGFKNLSSTKIHVLHIAANIVIISKDSTSYLLAPNEEIVYFEQTDCDIDKIMWLDFNRDFDTIKIFRADTLIKLWHGPLTESQTSLHTPYEIGDWERIEKKDTTILRFTITDKDFE
ncbi:MAG: hypothetical protein IKQ70_13380 [Bacteroidales bacterium]|nr:hypothetical protein [Bacteroidales bacterium]MBR6178851.1 hypothetical protein [Bacteroidales bacterium]